MCERPFSRGAIRAGKAAAPGVRERVSDVAQDARPARFKRSNARALWFLRQTLHVKSFSPNGFMTAVSELCQSARFEALHHSTDAPHL